MRHKLLVVLLLAVAAAPASAKSLHWSALGVTANLDRDGRLHVVERQVIVFDGDWNGGERTFRVATGQRLQFESIARVEGGVAHPLSGGDVDQVDHYKFFPGDVLRWRSRMPDDPPFENKPIEYVLTYTLSNILRESGGTYTARHDFAFPDRAGVIERYSLVFNLDPAWRGAKSPIVIQRANLQPGQSVIVPLQLTFAGANAPGAVIRTMSRTTMNAIAILFLAALAYLIFDFALHENERGRFTPILPPGDVDETFLKTNLLNLRPEVAGAALDNKTGAPEVAAVLAKLSQEGKIESSVGKKHVLTMKLKTDTSALPDYEGKLVRALFFSGDTTDTDKIRAHYKGRGFDPGQIIESGVKPLLAHIKEWKDSLPRANWKQDWIFLGVALAVDIVAALRGGEDTPIAVSIIVMGSLLFGLAALAAYRNSRAITYLVPRFAIPAVFLAPLVWFVWGYIRSSVYYALHLLTPIGISLVGLAFAKIVLDLLRTPESSDRIAFRKRLYAARNYFKAELRTEHPRIRDDWYPYLLAFGLGKHVDRWFGHFGSAAVTAGSSGPMLHASSSHSSSSSTASSAPAFTGGGGAFGGAGATGGWAIAAAAIGAGVAAPSSGGSGGGGGGGGGGSSSGGGGGGGW